MGGACRGALLSDGSIDGENIICGLHNWDFRYDTGISEYNNAERLQKFHAWIEDDQVFVDHDEIEAWHVQNPQPFARESYQGNYADTAPIAAEPHVALIQELAGNGLEKLGHHGAVEAMGVSREHLPNWDDLLFATAQLQRLPLLDEEPVDTKFILGPGSAKPLTFDMPIFISDMSFGALSYEAKMALATGADWVGTGICSGEGGMLPEEQQANSRYLYELASGRFGYSLDKVQQCQAFHFKCGQGAKTGTGGHLPGHKVTGRIAEVRGLKPGTDAISPARFPDGRICAHLRNALRKYVKRQGHSDWREIICTAY